MAVRAHYIADDLGIERSYSGSESTRVVTRMTWLQRADAALEKEMKDRLLAERLMDAWEQE